MENRVLVVALDGLDYELIKKYKCNQLTEMKEFGNIDNYTGIHSIKTSEEFASFITGELYGIHGIEGLGKPNNDFKKKNYFFFEKITFKVCLSRLFKICKCYRGTLKL